MTKNEVILKFDDVFQRIADSTDLKSATSLAKFLNVSSPAISRQKSQNTFPANWLINIAASYSVNLNYLVFGTDGVNLYRDEREFLIESVRYYISKSFPNSEIINNDSVLHIINSDIISLIEKYVDLSQKN